MFTNQSIDLTFNHFGLAVKDEEKSKDFLEKMNYVCHKEVFDKNQNVTAILMKHDSHPDIEIISKLKNDDVTPIDKILKNNLSATYHIAFETSHLDDIESYMKESNLRFMKIVDNMYSPLFDKEVSFHMTDFLGLVEIIHA